MKQSKGKHGHIFLLKIIFNSNRTGEDVPKKYNNGIMINRQDSRVIIFGILYIFVFGKYFSELFTRLQLVAYSATR